MGLKTLEAITSELASKTVPIALYGAGTSLQFFWDTFQEKQIPVVCICDGNSDKIGSSIFNMQICSAQSCLQNFPNCEFFLSLVTSDIQEEVTRTLMHQGVAASRIYRYSPTDPNEIRDFCAQYHKNSMNQYFSGAESPSSLNAFWSEKSLFYHLFSKLDLENVVELACGHGRHVEQYQSKAGQITLVDILDENILFCKNRFQSYPQVQYYKNNGSNFLDLPSDHYTALFTYDSMVHFESIDVYHYLQDTYRILKHGGRALFHHSNNTFDYKQSFNNSISDARSYMSAQLFAHYAHRAGLKILEQHPIDWKIKNLDCLTLVEKE